MKTILLALLLGACANPDFSDHTQTPWDSSVPESSARAERRAIEKRVPFPELATKYKYFGEPWCMWNDPDWEIPNHYPEDEVWGDKMVHYSPGYRDRWDIFGARCYTIACRSDTHKDDDPPEQPDGSEHRHSAEFDVAVQAMLRLHSVEENRASLLKDREQAADQAIKAVKAYLEAPSPY